MIARGKHIPTINESFAIRKSDGGVILNSGYDTPYSAAYGSTQPHEARDAIEKIASPTYSIEEAMKSRQED